LTLGEKHEKKDEKREKNGKLKRKDKLKENSK
jgi:hypothetical protein